MQNLQQYPNKVLPNNSIQIQSINMPHKQAQAKFSISSLQTKQQ